MNKLENARNAKDGKLFNFLNNQIRSEICSFQDQTVCCCGPEQITSSQLKLNTNPSSSNISGKFQIYFLWNLERFYQLDFGNIQILDSKYFLLMLFYQVGCYGCLTMNPFASVRK